MATPLRSTLISSLAGATVDNAMSNRSAENRLFITNPLGVRFEAVYSHETRQNARSDTKQKGKECTVTFQASAHRMWSRIALKCRWTCRAESWGLRWGENCREEHHEHDCLTNPGLFLAIRSIR